jgi:hypothetical protein
MNQQSDFTRNQVTAYTWSYKENSVFRCGGKREKGRAKKDQVKAGLRAIGRGTLGSHGTHEMLAICQLEIRTVEASRARLQQLIESAHYRPASSWCDTRDDDDEWAERYSPFPHFFSSLSFLAGILSRVH